MAAAATPAFDSTTNPPAPTRWPRLVPFGLAALFIAGVLLFARVFLPSELLGDDNTIHLSEIAALVDALRAHDWNLWNPSGNLGFPSAYYYQSLPQLSVALLHVGTFGQVPLLICYKLVVVIALAGPPVTTAWALHRVGRPRAEVIAAGIAVLLVGGRSQWGIASDSLFRTGLFTQTFAFLWFGPAVILGDRFLRTGRDFGLALLLALLTGMSHPFLGVVLGLFLVLRRVPFGELRVQTLRLVVLGVVLVIAAAALWLPILVDYDSFGGFPARVEFEEGLPPSRFLPLLVRGELFSLFGSVRFVRIVGDLFDLGGLPLFTIAGFAGWFVRAARRYAAWSTIAALLIMIGPSLGKTEDDLWPMIRLLAPMQWAHAIAAGITLWVGGTHAWKWLGAKWAQARTTKQRVWIAGLVVIAVGVGGFEFVVRLGVLFLRPDVADRANIGRSELTTLLAALAQQPRARVQVGKQLGTGNHFWGYLPFVYERFPAIATWAGAALQSSNNFVYLREEIPPATTALVFDAPYVLARPLPDRRAPKGEVIASSRSYHLLKLPTVGFVSGVTIIGTLPAHRFDRRKANLLWLTSDQPLLGRHYEYAGSQLAHNAAVVQLVKNEERPSQYRLTLDVTQRGTAAVRITYHPHWRATLDGKPLRLGRVSPDLIAFEVPEGTHTLELRFVRPLWHFLLYLLSMSLVAAAFAWDRWRARRDGVA